MAQKFLTSLDLGRNELLNATIHNLTETQRTALTTPTAGQIVFDTTLNTLFIYDGSSWVDLQQQGDVTAVTAGTGLTGGGSSGTVTLNIADTITAGEVGSSTAIPVLTYNAQGQLTAVSTASISSTLDIAADSGTDNGVLIGTDTLTISGGTGVATSVTGDTISVAIGQAVGTTSDVTFNSITGNLIGDVYASNGTSKILEAGTNGTDATFTGSVTGNATNVTGTVAIANGGTGSTTEAGARSNLSVYSTTETDSAIDTDIAAHAALTNTHGVSGAIVGTTSTQTLTNKTLTTPTLTLKQSTTPAPTAEGDIQWDTDNNQIKIGDGAGTKTFSDDSVMAATYQPLDSDLTTIADANNGSVLANTTASFTTADETKLDYITITQAVDLDAIETRVNALDAAVILMGTWDASAGTFPGGGTAQAGESYIVSTGGTVNSVVFTANDRILAITDNASTTTYAGNWHKLDYTDQVLSVDGATGAVSLSSTYQPLATVLTNTTASFTTDLETKLNGIEAGADVTDTANVTAAGALMDSEVDADIKTLSLPANTTISTFGASLVDDADAATARATLGVDAAGTDNSTDVTLAGTLDYLTLSGQQITLGSIVLTTDVSGTLPVANGGTGGNSTSTAKSSLGFMTRYAANVGNGSDTAIAVTHSLNTNDVMVEVYDASTLETVVCDVGRTSTNQVTLTFASAPASNAYRVVIIG